MTFELGFVDLRGILRSKSFSSPRGDAWFSETVLMHRYDGTAAKCGHWGQLHHPSMLARVSSTYQLADSEFGFSNLVGQGGEPHALCSRSLLAGTEARFASSGLHPTVGYELEFYVDGEAASRDPLERSGQGLYSSRLQGGDGFLIVERLLDQGAVVRDTIHDVCREYGQGQYEVGTTPAAATVAADRLVLIRGLLKAVARQAEHPINLDPLPYVGRVGSALQVSVVLGGLCDTKAPSNALKACAAAIARSTLDNALVFGSVPESYLRFHNEEFASIQDWGMDRRDSLVRIARCGDGWRLEVRLADSRANVHLITHVVLHALLEFLEQPPCDPTTPVPVVLPDSMEAAVERFAESTTGGIPRDMREALAAVLSRPDQQDRLGDASRDQGR